MVRHGIATPARLREQKPAVITIQEARRIVLEQVSPLSRTERLPVTDCVGRRLAEDVHADSDMPPFDRVTMDGFAVRAGDTGAGARLSVDGEVAAGARGESPLLPGTARAIMTGAPLPPGADAVIQVEWTSLDGQQVEFTAAVRPGQNVAPQGEDLLTGGVVGQAGQRVTTLGLSLLIASGAADVAVYARPRVALLTSGDELVPPGAPIRRGQIRESNGPALAALFSAMGAEVIRLGVAADTREDLARLVKQGLQADLVVLTGGSSVGRYDFSAEVVESFGAECHFRKLSVKPGKPTLFHSCGGSAVFCLPGNPVAALMTGRVLVALALERMAGGQPAPWPGERLPLLAPLRRNPQRDLIVPVRVLPEGLAFEGWHGSGDLVCMSRCEAFAFVDRGDEEAPVGTLCPVFRLPSQPAA
ncbi:MAG: molybdopterin molybdotransferase [Pseudohongiellaceae bacterium]|jgi:molybdopterin molybdotransferase